MDLFGIFGTVILCAIVIYLIIGIGVAIIATRMDDSDFDKKLVFMWGYILGQRVWRKITYKDPDK